MDTHPLIVMNNTDNNLMVSGSSGSDRSQVALNKQILPHNGLIVAYFATPGGLGDNWDWVYITDNTNQGTQYQIYVEYNSSVDWLPPILCPFRLQGYA